MPLIEPYELINIFGSDDDRFNPMVETWTLKLIHNRFSAIRAKEINITNGIIYGLDPEVSKKLNGDLSLSQKTKKKKYLKITKKNGEIS
jgi:hypothetical protein